jgi:spermidine synthase
VRIECLALILFFVSGLTSLAYESIFFVLLRRVFGVTAYATSTVVAAFMAGLALGSFCFWGWVGRWTRHVRVYGLMELAIGVYCYCAPHLIDLSIGVYSFLYIQQHFSPLPLTAIRFLISFLILIVPSFLMGGTLPVISQFLLRSSEEIQWKLPKLYAINTLGGSVGVFLSTYLLFLNVGIRNTLRLMVILNLIVFLAALLLDRFRKSVETADTGVLQQWVQLHHMRRQDLLVILNTARSVFPHMAFFFGGRQGYLVASCSPLVVDYERLKRWNKSDGFGAFVRTIPFGNLFPFLETYC